MSGGSSESATTSAEGRRHHLSYDEFESFRRQKDSDRRSHFIESVSKKRKKRQQMVLVSYFYTLLVSLSTNFEW